MSGNLKFTATLNLSTTGGKAGHEMLTYALGPVSSEKTLDDNTIVRVCMNGTVVLKTAGSVLRVWTVEGGQNEG
jgi:hypothetical protein